MLDLDAVERRAKDAPYTTAAAFAWGSRDDVLTLIAALRAVLETTPQELMEAMYGVELTRREEAALALAYLKRKAGVV